jgi:hypothetical protein
MANHPHPNPAPPPTRWRQCLYRSRLADPRGYEVFGSLARLSRMRNASHGIGGCLLFDGQHFCQLIEGPEPAVTALWNLIGSDARHCDIVLLHERRLPAPERRADWHYGYCGADELECFDRPAACKGLDALAAFEAIRARADLAS